MTTILTVDDLKTGMVLAEPVLTHQDRILFEAGRRITEKTIRVFKSWGIRRVAVKSPAGAGNGLRGAPPGAAPALDAGLTERFAGLLDDPLMQEIMQAAGRQLTAHQSRKKSRHGRI